jgi:hypothetical protein
LEYDFIVAPGADPSVVRMDFEGVSGLRSNPAGNVVFVSAGGDLLLNKPRIYQDRSVDQDGNAFVVGVVDSNTAFVTKLDPEGRRTYFTTLAGYPTTTGRAIAIDESGNAHVTGDTLSVSFPAMNALQPRAGRMSCFAIGGGVFPMDAFVAKLGPTGTIVYATYLGGDGNDWGLDIAVDRKGNVYITGETSSVDFPVIRTLQAAIRGGDPKTEGSCGGDDAFLAKLDPSGSVLLYGTYLGGSRYDTATSVAVDPEGNVYLAGNTRSHDFPMYNALQSMHAGGEFDGFVVKLKSDERNWRTLPISAEAIRIASRRSPWLTVVLLM